MTTPGEHAARTALRDSVEEDRDQVALVTGSRLLLRSDIREAVRDGIADAMTDDNAERFWAKGLEVLQRQATEKTGEFVLDGLSALAKRLTWVGLLLLAFFMLGGWPALKAGWALVIKGPP